MAWTMNKFVFPDGFPKTIDQFNPDQRRVVVQLGAARVLYFLGLLDQVLPCSTKNFQLKTIQKLQQLYKKSKKDSSALVELSKLKMEIREVFYLGNIIERETAGLSSSPDPEVYFILGGLHDLDRYSRSNLKFHSVDLGQ